MASRLGDAERVAERLVREAHAAARAADERAEHELAETMRLLEERTAVQRALDARTIEAETQRRARLFADADTSRLEAIAEQLALLAAPATNGA